jgi:hypothetical protein
MNIRFTSSLTAADENSIAPVLIRAITGILDLLPIAYAIRIDTADATTFEHREPAVSSPAPRPYLVSTAGRD